MRPATSALLHPLLRRVAWGGPGIRQNGGAGLGRAMKLLSPTLDHHPARVKGGTAGPPHLRYTQNIPKEELSQRFLLTRWDKSSPGGSESHLVGFKEEERAQRHSWTWASRVHEQHDPPNQAYNRQPHSTNTSDYLMRSINVQ